MSEDLNEITKLEERLRSLRPAPVPPALLGRLHHAEPERRRFALRTSVAVAAAAMIAVGVGLVHWRSTPHRPATADTSPGARSMGELVLAARDAGVWHAEDGRPYRVVHCLTAGSAVPEGLPDGTWRVRGAPRQRVLLVAMSTQ
jgi:hypothetical protein